MSTSYMQQHALSLSSEELSLLHTIFPQGLVAFDTETTGLSPLTDEIIEIAAVKIFNHEATFFQTLIKPTVLVRDEIIAIHGIGNDMLKNSPEVSVVLPEFFSFLGNSALVAHNAKFDLGFLVFQSSKLKLTLPELDCYCSCLLSRVVFSELESHKLGNLAKHFKIVLDQHHRALDDSLACLQVFIQSLKKETGFASICLSANLKDYNLKQNFSLPESLKLLETWAGKNKKLEILYSGGSMRGKFRPIIPLSLLPMPAGNILYAHCLVSDQYKSFALSKIKEVRLLESK